MLQLNMTGPLFCDVVENDLGFNEVDNGRNWSINVYGGVISY